MGNVKIDEKLYKRFQYYVLRRKGQKKGNVKIAAEEAINLWIEKTRADVLAQNKVEMEDYASIEEYMANDLNPKREEWRKQFMDEMKTHAERLK